MFREAADNGLCPPDYAAAIGRVNGAPRRGTRTGTWLDRGQAEQLLSLPDGKTAQGKRDRALLCPLVGCGLRREELAMLEVASIQQRDGRWAIVDLSGKGQRVRTVPMPPWAKAVVDDWVAAAGITAQAVYDIVARYAAKLGLEVAPTICGARMQNWPTRAIPRSNRFKFRSATRPFSLRFHVFLLPGPCPCFGKPFCHVALRCDIAADRSYLIPRIQ